MRYYKTIINTNTEDILATSIERLKQYGYINSKIHTNIYGAVNEYFYQNLNNGIFFLVYREEADGVYAGIAFDEEIYELECACEEISEYLKNEFSIKNLHFKPKECTMFEFDEIITESKRREMLFGTPRSKYYDSINVYSHYYLDTENNNANYFLYEEVLLPEEKIPTCSIFEQGFINELANIEEHKNSHPKSGNVVHYIISGRSTEVCNDMAITLANHLFMAGRIDSRRVGMISEIRPDIFKSGYIDKIIENNKYSAVVISLSEKFGYASTQYKQAVEFLKRIVKEYRNSCLFIFTYNINSPGFSYDMLCDLNKYLIPVQLREGSGNRKEALRYLKSLINSSEYAKYSSQACEFFKQYPGSVFTQTDVMLAYEQFESWCLNKNFLQAYADDLRNEFLLDRDENAESAEQKLNEMVGLHAVKKQIAKIIDTDVVEKERKNRLGHKYKMGTMHMIFAGNPGSAKTTVARLFGGIAKEKRVLKSGIVVECGGMDLDGLGCVQTIRDSFDAAKGGVLFIDEAYALSSQTATTVLIQEMENHREDVIVILAGYKERMQEFMEQNEGLKSRIPYWVEFPDYNENELTEIFKLMLEEKGFQTTDDALKQAQYIFEKACHLDNFGNGRYVRNLLEKSIQEQSERVLAEKKDVSEIQKKDLFLLKREDIKMPEDGLLKERAKGDAQKELDEMIGLSTVKNVLSKAITSFKYKRLLSERGLSMERASYHMVFTGNPGTAKTTVARLLAEILNDEKVLPTGTFVEVGRGDLVGTVVGSTAQLVKKRFKEAQGGVLFIDEAYSLCDGHVGGYGDEAINTIIQEMENHREDVIVIFAGYPKQMKEFLERNPGMSSRIAFHIEFEDYSVDELCDITKLMVRKNNMQITDEAMQKLRDDYEKASKNDDYGNGRYVRTILEEAEMNLAQRIIAVGDVAVSTEVMTTIEADDIPEKTSESLMDKKNIIGFCA